VGPVTGRSRDNLPNPVVSAANPYVPDNTPAISDLFDVFSFTVNGGGIRERNKVGVGSSTEVAQ
jgi:hypothetical protein